MFYYPKNPQLNYQLQPMMSAGEEVAGNRFTKRLKTSSQQHYNQNWSSGSIHQFPVSPAQFNPLDEPSPLGLKLRKSPSFLDLIQTKLSETNASSYGTALAPAPGEIFNVEKKNDVRGSATTTSIDKLKASNFLASSLQIGGWKYVSRHEGDLVAKCYYSKHKLVWEVLDGGLKNKIEIQWSDIVDLNATYPDDQLELGDLNIVLSRPPIFFRESDPQPRKHTVWQVATDFTHGHASMHRQHFLRCPQGVLKKHYEKLIQCDMRLKCLSEQPAMVLHTPYFASQASGSKGDVSRNQVANQLETAKVFPISGIQNVVLPFSASSKVEHMGTYGIALHGSIEASSPSSGATEANELCHRRTFSSLKNQEQSKVLGLHQSMSVNDLMNHVGDYIAEQMTYEESYECNDVLGNISRHLFDDNHVADASDEKYLMSRVNSLDCLLQGRVVDSPDEPDRETNMNGNTEFEQKNMCNSTPVNMFNIDAMGHEKDITLSNSYEQQPGLRRSASFENFLRHIHRMGSFSNLLLDSEDGDNHT